MSSTQPSTSSVRVRRLALAAILVSATGCASGQPSLASLNPFQSGAADGTAPPTIGADKPSAASSFVQGTRSQASSMSMAVSSAFEKGRNSLASLFGPTATSSTGDGTAIAANDPLLLQNRPDSVGPEVFVANGQLWESTGNFEQAMENYAKALQRDANNAPALASIARLHLRQNQLEQGIDYFQRAIKADPSEASLYHDMGLALSRQGKHDEALAAVNKALAIAPGTSRYANSHAAILFSAGREDEAKAEMLKHNKPAVAHYNLAYLYYTSQRTDQALQELAAVLKLGPQTGGDSASQKAYERSKELFDQLGGPATQIAEALPQLYGAASETGAAVAALGQDVAGIAAEVRDTASGVSVQLSSQPSATKTAVAQPPQAAPAATEVAAKPAPATNSPASTPTAKMPIVTMPTAQPPVATEVAATPKPTAANPEAPETPDSEAAVSKVAVSKVSESKVSESKAPEASTAPAPATAQASATEPSNDDVKPASGSMFALPPGLMTPPSDSSQVRTADGAAEETKTR